jgi:hypothetical protein
MSQETAQTVEPATGSVDRSNGSTDLCSYYGRICGISSFHDFVVKGVMIGGFALVAAPAEYSVTGVKTFIVSHDGVVYDKDLGPKTLDQFNKMERFNPDKSWTPVAEKYN